MPLAPLVFKHGTGSTGPSSEASMQIGDIDILKEHGTRRARGSIITGSRYDPLVRVGSSTTGGVEPNIANELAEEKKLIMQDKSFAGLGNLIPKETLKASTYVPATGAASGATGMKMKDSKAVVDSVATAMLKRLENVKATEGKKAISKLKKEVESNQKAAEIEKDVARKDEEEAEEARELAEQNPSKDNEEAADKAEEKALEVEDKAAKLKDKELRIKKKELELEKAISKPSGSTGSESPMLRLLKTMSETATGPSSELAEKFLAQEGKETGISGATGVTSVTDRHPRIAIYGRSS